jgi:hypothetical protein
MVQLCHNTFLSRWEVLFYGVNLQPSGSSWSSFQGSTSSQLEEGHFYRGTSQPPNWKSYFITIMLASVSSLIKIKLVSSDLKYDKMKANACIVAYLVCHRRPVPRTFRFRIWWLVFGSNVLIGIIVCCIFIAIFSKKVMSRWIHGITVYISHAWNLQTCQSDTPSYRVGAVSCWFALSLLSLLFLVWLETTKPGNK